MSSSSVDNTPVSETGASLLPGILRELDSASEPQTAAKLRSRLMGPFKRPLPEIKELLKQAVADGKAVEFTPFNSPARSPRYWVKTHEQYARQVMIEKLEGCLLTASLVEAGTKSKLLNLSQAQRRKLLQQMVADKEIRQLPPYVGGRAKLYTSSEVSPRPYLERVVEKLSKNLKACGVSQEDIFAAMAKLASGPPQNTPSQPVTAAAKPPLADTIFERALETPGVAHGAPVRLRQLRQQFEFNATKEEFDAAVLVLFRAGRVDLHSHDRAAGLTDEERQAYVADGAGQYYVYMKLKLQEHDSANS